MTVDLAPPRLPRVARRPHVLIATVLSASGNTGVETHISQARDALLTAGAGVEIVTPFSWGGPLRHPAFAPRRVLDPISGAAAVAWYRYWHFLFLRGALERCLADASDAVIYAQCPLSALAALRARRSASQRVVMTVHFDTSQADEWVDKEKLRRNSRLYLRIKSLECQVLPALDGIVYVCDSARRALADAVPAVENVPSILIPNFLSDTDPPFTPRRAGELVSVGGLEIAKNHEFLVRVLAEARGLGRSYHLDIVGEGPCRSSLAAAIRSSGLGEQVRLLGPRDDVRTLLPHYRAYVHAGTREALPFSVVEAMAAGLPILAGPVGGIPEVVQPGVEGVLWPLDDPRASARLMIDLFDDPSRMARMAAASRARFDRDLSAAVAGPELVRFLAATSPQERNGRTHIDGAFEARPIPDLRHDEARPMTGRSRRATVTTIDHCVYSVSNFAVGVAIARIAGVAGLGAYSFAYALWLVVQALHRSLITEPMTIDGGVRRPGANGYLASGSAAELILGLIAAVAFVLLSLILLATGQHAFGIAVLALAPWLPVLVIQDYWRYAGFMQGDPAKALVNDVLFDGVQAAMFVVLVAIGFRSPVVAIASWGAGAATGAVFGFRQFRIHPTRRGSWSRLTTHWQLSKWLSVNSVMAWGSTQSYSLLTAAILGPIGIGGLRAAQTLVSGPSLVILQSGSSLGLPEASRGLAEGGPPKLRRVTRGLTAATTVSVGLIAVIVFVFGPALLRIFFGSAFTKYSTAAILLACSAVINSLALGPLLTLKALGRTRSLAAIAAISIATSSIAMFSLAPVWGVSGAAAGALMGTAASWWGIVILCRRAVSGRALSSADHPLRAALDHSPSP